MLAQLWADQGVYQVANIDWERDKYLINAHFPPHAFDTPEKQRTVDNMFYKIHDGENWRLGSEEELVQMINALEFLPESTVEKYVSNLSKFYAALSGTDATFNQKQTNKEFDAGRNDEKQRRNEWEQEFDAGRNDEKQRRNEWRQEFAAGRNDEGQRRNERRQEFLLKVQEVQDKLNKGEDLTAEEEKLLVQKQLIDELGENYFTTPWKKLTNKQRAAARNLATLTGDSLSTAEIDNIDFTSRMLLGGKILAETSTRTSIGLVDNAVNTLKLYLIDTEKNQHARSAYYTIFNNMAKLMAGLTLTASEISSVKNQIGTLNIQPKQLFVNMQTLYSSIYQGLKTRSEAMNPWVGRFYYGKLMDETKKVLDNITTTLRYNDFNSPQSVIDILENKSTGGRSGRGKPEKEAENKPMSDAEAERIINEIYDNFDEN